ncbi:MAG: MBL fold metallo-hydrolase [Haemophilus parainfluenzae]
MNIEIIPVTAFQQNCSLIWDDEKNAAIIDPGGNAEKLIQRIEELELNLKAVLLTHGHLDHVGAAEAIRDHFNIEIWGSQEEDRFLFESLPQQAQQFGYLIFLHLHLIAGLIKKAKTKWTFTFEILHLPGHTPGYIGLLNMKKYCFYWRVLFQNSIGRTDFVGISTP